MAILVSRRGPWADFQIRTSGLEFWATARPTLRRRDTAMITTFDLARELQATVEQELEPGERIEWLGMPIPRYFTPVSTGVFLLGIPWTAFAVFWVVAAGWLTARDRVGPFIVFPLFGLPFILVGLGMLSVPLWTRRRALRSVYVITDRRAITFVGGWGTTIRSYPPEKLQEVYRRERRDGTGDVIIVRRAWYDPDGDRRSEELGFLRIANPKEVEDLLKRLADQAQTGPAEPRDK